MKKKLLILIPLVLVFLVLVLWRPIASYYMHSCLTGYCKEYLDGELAFGSFTRDNGKWVIEDLSIDTENRKFRAEKVNIVLGFKPFSREVDLNISVVNPRIDIQKKTSELQAFFLECVPFNLSNWAFNVNSRITVEEGVISWSENQQAIFRLNGSCQSGSLDGRLVMKIEEGNAESNIFEMKVSQTGQDPILAELNFHEIDCAPFCEAVKGFGISLNGWDVTQGIINGKITLNFEGEKRPQVIGKALLQNLAFNHPELKVEGKVQEAKLDVRTEKMRDGHQGVVGKVEVTEDASIVLLNEGIPYWEIKRILGGVYFQGKDLAIVNIEGTCTHRDVTFGLNIEGDVRFPDAYQSSLDIAVELISPDENIAPTRLIARQLGALYNSAEIELKNIGKEEFAFVQAALARYSPEWKKIQMYGGSIDASGIVYMQRYRINEVNIDHISAERLRFEILPWDAVLSVSKAYGDLSMSLLKEDLLETINSNINIDGGNFWEFRDINTELKVRNGVIQKSILKGAFAGMKGTVEIDWLAQNEVIKLNFNGGTQGLGAFLPEVLKKGVEENFSEDHITLLAKVNKLKNSLQLEGMMSIVGGATDNLDTIAFGADLNRVQNAESSAERLKAIKELLPTITTGQVINSDMSIAGFYVRNGWFKVEHIPLEKYLSPFLNSKIKFSGIGNFSGFMDLNQMAVEYEGKNIVIDSPHFKIILPTVAKETIHNPVHFFDLANGTHFGLVPIRGGTYLQKRYGLTFTNVNGNLFLEGEKLRLEKTTAMAHGVAVSGQVDMDLTQPDIVSMELSNFEASLKQYQAKGNIRFEDFKKDLGEFNLSITDTGVKVAHLDGKVSALDPRNTLIDLNNEFTQISDIHPSDLKFIINSEPNDIRVGVNLKMNEVSIAGELIPTSEKILFESLQYKYGNSLSFVMDGEFIMAEKAVDATIRELNLLMDHLNEWTLIKEWTPVGKVLGSGKIRFELKDEAPGWNANAILNTSFHNWGVKGMSFVDAKDVSCHFVSDKGITLRHIKSGPKSADGVARGTAELDTAKFDFDKEEFSIEGLRFEIPVENINWFANTLAKTFPEEFDSSLVETISEAKSEGAISGTFQVKNEMMKFTLDEGVYQFLNANHTLKDFTLEIDPLLTKFSTIYKYGNHLFKIEFASQEFDHGDLILSANDEVMKVSWTKDQDGFLINRALGQFAGLQVDLTLNEDLLSGTVKIDASKAASLFPPEMGEKIKNLAIGDGFLLKGDWKVSNGDTKFTGLLLGKDFQFYGYQFDTLTAKVESNNSHISLREIKVVDPAVAVNSEKIDMVLENDNWHATMPELMITKLRPSILCPAGGTRPLIERPLIFKEIVLNDFNGVLADPTTYKGEGYLSFTNKSKNPLQNTIFDVPAEIVARLGLDLAVMTPVIGGVNYEIKDGKIVLNKFKDMFSERKLSKFYLSENHLSTIDFDGNLNLQVRMKQYNLLFKLTEPFSFNIQGPYSKPNYRVNADNKRSL